MKLKYYLRGMGIGIIFTAVIFLFVNIATGSSDGNKVSQTETKTTGSVLAYATTQADNETQATTIAEVKTDKLSRDDNGNDKEATAQDDTKEQITTGSKTSETDKSEEKTTAGETTTTDNSNAARNGEMVEVEIRNIKYLSEVSEILYDKGIISDVNGFNSYMTFSGNDLKVKEGRYTLKAGDTFENIAGVITRS